MITLQDKKYKAYVDILKRELVSAMGCTEPIAIAFAAAKAREILGKIPEKVIIYASGNIIKNAKSATVPNTDGLKGIEAAAAVGIVAGDASKELEVISKVSAAQKKEVYEFLKKNDISIALATSDIVLDILVEVASGEDSAKVRVSNKHTHIVLMEKNGQVLLNREVDGDMETFRQQEAMLNVDDIITFADICSLDDVEGTLARQVAYNMAIAKEGLQGDYGACVGKTIAESRKKNDVISRAVAMAAAGSDARMSGCNLPVIINSGSGNQGITVCVPVVVYAETYQLPRDRMYRALLISNLISIHQKRKIGNLSAFCGAVSAGCAAAAGIDYLLGGDRDEIAHTFVNGMAINAGIVCDGAKPSCAGKIASSIYCGLLAMTLAKKHHQFKNGEGIITKGIENTISNVARLGREGMKQTDQEILQIMIGK